MPNVENKSQWSSEEAKRLIALAALCRSAATKRDILIRLERCGRVAMELEKLALQCEIDQRLVDGHAETMTLMREG